MTHPLEDVERVLWMKTLGMSRKAIADAIGICRTTIRSWLEDPGWALSRRRSTGMGCGASCRIDDAVRPGPYGYLLGMYLGDGHIVRYPRAYRLSVYCDSTYEGIIEDVVIAMRETLPNEVSRHAREGCVEVYSYSQHWPCLFPQHGPGRKHERSIVLAPWQRRIVHHDPRPFLRGLLHSDGCRVENVAVRHVGGRVERRYYSRYHSSNRSDDVKGLFCEACDVLGIRWKVANERDITVNRRDDVELLDGFVGPKR